MNQTRLTVPDAVLQQLLACIGVSRIKKFLGEAVGRPKAIPESRRQTAAVVKQIKAIPQIKTAVKMPAKADGLEDFTEADIPDLPEKGSVSPEEYTRIKRKRCTMRMKLGLAGAPRFRRTPVNTESTSEQAGQEGKGDAPVSLISKAERVAIARKKWRERKKKGLVREKKSIVPLAEFQMAPRVHEVLTAAEKPAKSTNIWLSLAEIEDRLRQGVVRAQSYPDALTFVCNWIGTNPNISPQSKALYGTSLWANKYIAHTWKTSNGHRV
jgi:hypothetical protein